MIKIGDIIENRYKVLYLAGRGGMSKVWLAKDIKLNKNWAIKEIDKTSKEYSTVNELQALSEIEMLKSLDHPAFPRIVSVVDSEDSICVVMDYIEGENLLEYLDRNGEQREETVVKWMLDVCDILDYLHSQNPPVIYRDLKPSNIMLNQDGHIKIIDFGIARKKVKGKDDTMPLGTSGYASPEHFTKHTDARSDIYTVGITMYQLLTGIDPMKPPFELRPLRQIDPSLSSGLEKIIIKATMRDPDKRYQTAKELANALASFRKLDIENMEVLQERLAKYKKLLISAVAVIVLGVSILTTSLIIDNNTYNTLISGHATNTETKIENIKRAIEIKPRKTEGYLKLIEAYAEDGLFTEEESAELLSIYAKHQDVLNNNEDLNYMLGEAILEYYTGKTDNSVRAKLLTAEPYFRNAKNSNLAKNYVFFAEYYRQYILADDSLVSKSQNKKGYNDLIVNCNDAIKNVSDSDAKMKAITSEIILNIIDTERLQMMESGISESKMIDVVENAGQLGESNESCKELAKQVESNIRSMFERKQKKTGI